MSYIDWDDVLKKLMPTHLRYPWHLDWINIQAKGLKDIHATSTVLTDALDVKSDFNSAVAMLRRRMNDIFDPYHRGVYFVQQNFNVGNTRGFRVEVPTYLEFGDIEDRMNAVLNYYIHYGQTHTYTYSAASFTHAVKTYIDALTTPGDTEMWSIINFYNKVRGHGMWANFERINLMSPSSIGNAKIALTGSTLAEAGGGSIDWDRWGFASDGARYLTTGYNPNTATLDIKNSASLYYISKLGTTPLNWSEGGSFDGTPDYNTFGVTNNGSAETVAVQGLAGDTVNGGSGNAAGAYLVVANAGKLRIRKNKEYIGSEDTLVGAAAQDQAEFLCAESQAGVAAKFSKNKLATWIRYKGAMATSQQIALNNAVVEYNNLNSR